MPSDSEDLSDLPDWLWLVHCDGIGPVRGQALLRRFGAPPAIRAAHPDDIAATLGSARLARQLLADDPARQATCAAALAWQRAATETERNLIPLGDPRYPRRLLDLHDAPLLLYCDGDWRALERTQVAIVGSRNATVLGLRTASTLAQALGEAGLVVTSGLAEGIDRAAHAGALAGSGQTVAVLGTGIDRIYPARHRPLADRISASGALLAEQAPGMAPLPGNFPRRNRLIAALASTIVVVEAAMKSGSLITARVAADLGREVMAVPGSIHSPLARGCHALLRQGAGVAESVDDVLATLPHDHGMRVRSPQRQPPVDDEAAIGPDRELTAEQSRLLASLTADPVLIETLAGHHGWSVAGTLAAVQMLEIAGRIQRQPDGSYVRLN